MRKMFFVAVLIAIPISIYAQKHDFTLVFGYAGGNESPNDDAFGINVMTFDDGSAKLSDNQIINMGFNDTNVSMSDANGNLAFYYNGIYIENAEFKLMEGGDTLNLWQDLGSDIPQGAISIPYPGHVGKYILLHETEDYIVSPLWGFQAVELFYSIIDMNQNGGLGRVTERKKLLIADTLTYGQLTAVRHANGRDWWVIVGESHTNRFYKLLINSSGIHQTSIQSVGPSRQEGFGHAFFSPDGTKYASSQGIDFGPNWGYLYIYDFDRCSGFLSNGQEIHIVGNVGSGIAISPNSRFLYAAVEEYLYQFDLQAGDIEASRLNVGTYIDYLDPFPTKFDRCFLAPDGKIYVVTSSGSRTLHLVTRPDELGLACEFQQHSVKLPCNNARSFPNFPNYRLGPIDGSNCDSLGIDNIPMAWWRWEKDTLDNLTAYFTDLSFYEPISWLWDFGDGSTSTEQYPAHTFDAIGDYIVCLTVGNANSNNILCRTLKIGTTLTKNPEVSQSVLVSPNPFKERLFITLNAPLRSPVFKLYDQTGRNVHMEQIAYGLTEVQISSLPAGMYFWEVSASGEFVKSGIVVKTQN